MGITLCAPHVGKYMYCTHVDLLVQLCRTAAVARTVDASLSYR